MSIFSSVFTSEAAEARYNAFFGPDGKRGRYWHLNDGEFTAAEALLRLSPALREYGRALDRKGRVLNVGLLHSRKPRTPEAEVMITALVTFCTVPQVTRGMFHERALQALTYVSPADMRALFSALLARAAVAPVSPEDAAMAVKALRQ